MPFDPTGYQEAKLEPWQEVLLEAAKIVRVRWTRGAFGSAGGPRCALGAIYEASNQGRKNGANEAARLLHAFLGEHVAIWNDHPSRTAQEVARVMEEAALHHD